MRFWNIFQKLPYNKNASDLLKTSLCDVRVGISTATFVDILCRYEVGIQSISIKYTSDCSEINSLPHGNLYMSKNRF